MAIDTSRRLSRRALPGIVVAAGACLLAACVPKEELAKQQAEGPPIAAGAPVEGAVQPKAAGPAKVEGKIDWQAARDSRLKAGVTDANRLVLPQSVQDAPAVPVLLPSGIVTPQSAAPPRVVPTKDGYFATYQTPKYSAVVNGTNQGFQTGSAEARTDMKFTASDGGAQMAFRRYGADYLVEFECRQVDSGSCITESEAKAFVESLFVAASQ